MSIAPLQEYLPPERQGTAAPDQMDITALDRATQKVSLPVLDFLIVTPESRA